MSEGLGLEQFSPLVFATTQLAVRDGSRSSQNGPHENASELRESFVQQWNCPTQAKIGLEWAPVSQLSQRSSAAPPKNQDGVGWTAEGGCPYVSWASSSWARLLF